MAPGIGYDDSGSLASYFGVTCLALVLIPATVVTLRPQPADRHKSLCDCSECRQNEKRKRVLRSAARQRRLLPRLGPLLLGWALFAWLAWGLYNAPPLPETQVYDPFEILGLKTSATEKDIKKHYKKLSLQFHPDKIQLAQNETMEDAETKYVEITKAYKALTDEAIRENVVKYGNPDGPQQREDRIAIPKWVVEGKSSGWVLAAYGIILGLGIPYVVGRWWFRSRSTTRDGIMNATAETFFHQLREDTDFISLVALLASAAEFQRFLSPKNKNKKERKERQAKIEELEKLIDETRSELLIEENPQMKKDSRVIVNTAAARRARVLLWAHLLRLEISDDLVQEQLEVLRALPPLLQGLSNISLAHNRLKTSLLCFKLQSALVQALPVGASPLAQLPGISLEDAQDLSILHGAEGSRWVEKFLKRTGGVEGVEEARKVAQTWPVLEVTDAEFNVHGEKLVTPGSIVTLSVKCRWTYPKAVVANGTARGESVDVVEGAITPEDKSEDDKDESAWVSESDAEKIPEKISEKPKKRKRYEPTAVKKDYPPTGYAHAPHWPANRSPAFNVLLGDSKLDKVIVQPARFADIPMPTSSTPIPEAREYTLQFQAPPQPNLYSFIVYLTSDTFVGADIARPIMLRVEEAPEEEDSDDEISEPEEDSLAGQMALMRGGKVKPSDVHGDESEYETDSSSDEEGPRRGRAINEDTDSDSD